MVSQITGKSKVQGSHSANCQGIVSGRLVELQKRAQTLYLQLKELHLRLRNGKNSDQVNLKLAEEYEHLCCELVEVFKKLKELGFDKVAILDQRKGIVLVIDIAHELTVFLSLMEDRSAQKAIAELLGKVLILIKAEIGKDIQLAEKHSQAVEEFLHAVEELDIDIDTNLEQQLAPLLAAETEKETPVFSAELPSSIPFWFQGLNTPKDIWEVIAKWERERDKMVEELAEKKQEERLEERRLEEKREAERIAQEKINERRDQVALAVKATEYRRQSAINFIDRVEAEIQHNLIELELRHLQNQNKVVV